MACFFLFCNSSIAQKKQPAYDSSFYETYPRHITGRFFFSKKYTGFTLQAPQGVKSLRYKPNRSFSAGAGATYGALTLNLAFDLGFLNPSKTEKGKTTSIDLQSHIYTRQWVVDLYGQFYKGYYLSPLGYAAADANSFYTRRDIKVNLLGASVYRLLNDKEFSYRASFLQNEWQKQSAGSFLIGGEIYTGAIKADSALVPAVLANNYQQKGITKTSFIEFGPGVGYAYTYVYQKNFFATGSITVNADVSFVKEFSATGTEKKTSISPNAVLRAVVGYNSNDWGFAISWVNNSTNLRGYSSDDAYLIRTGNFRVTFAKRFKPGRKLKKRLEVIDQLPGSK